MTLIEAQERTKEGVEIKIAIQANEKLKISLDGTEIAEDATRYYLEWSDKKVEMTAPTLVTGKDHFIMFGRVIKVTQ